MICSDENHVDAVLAAIQSLDDFDLTPVEKMMILTTASQLMENKIEAAATALGLKQITDGPS